MVRGYWNLFGGLKEGEGSDDEGQEIDALVAGHRVGDPAGYYGEKEDRSLPLIHRNEDILT
jgi:hypothetical protein